MTNMVEMVNETGPASLTMSWERFTPSHSCGCHRVVDCTPQTPTARFFSPAMWDYWHGQRSRSVSVIITAPTTIFNWLLSIFKIVNREDVICSTVRSHSIILDLCGFWHRIDLLITWYLNKNVKVFARCSCSISTLKNNIFWCLYDL